MSRIIFVFFFACGIACAEIRTTAYLLDVKHEVFRSNVDTLVIFDVDQTLIELQDQIFSYNSLRHFLALQKDMHVRHPIKEKQQYLQSIVMESSESQLVHPNTIQIFNQIQGHNKNVIFLTAMETGVFGRINNLEDWRINDLKQLGFNLSNNFANTAHQQLDPYLRRTSPSCSPVFKNDILFCCFLEKGDVLKAYLQHINLKPSKIIFVDDRRYHVESVA